MLSLEEALAFPEPVQQLPDATEERCQQHLAGSQGVLLTIPRGKGNAKGKGLPGPEC